MAIVKKTRWSKPRGIKYYYKNIISYMAHTIILSNINYGVGILLIKFYSFQILIMQLPVIIYAILGAIVTFYLLTKWIFFILEESRCPIL